MKYFISSIVLLLLLTAAGAFMPGISSPAVENQSSCCLTFKVLDRNGAPQAGCKVSLSCSICTSLPPLSGVTGPDGTVRICGIPSGINMTANADCGRLTGVEASFICGNLPSQLVTIYVE